MVAVQCFPTARRFLVETLVGGGGGDLFVCTLFLLFVLVSNPSMLCSFSCWCPWSRPGVGPWAPHWWLCTATIASEGLNAEISFHV